MTPKVNFFQNFFRDLSTGPNYVSWSNLAKIGCCEVPERSRRLPNKKNSGSAGLVPAPILSKMGLSRPKFSERRHPLTCLRIPNLVRIGCVLLDLFRKDWFRAKKSIQYIRLSAYKYDENCVFHFFHVINTRQWPLWQKAGLPPDLLSRHMTCLVNTTDDVATAALSTTPAHQLVVIFEHFSTFETRIISPGRRPGRI